VKHPVQRPAHIPHEKTERAYHSSVWRLASGVWRLASGVWRLASGVWRLASGIL